MAEDKVGYVITPGKEIPGNGNRPRVKPLALKGRGANSDVYIALDLSVVERIEKDIEAVDKDIARLEDVTEKLMAQFDDGEVRQVINQAKLLSKDGDFPSRNYSGLERSLGLLRKRRHHLARKRKFIECYSKWFSGSFHQIVLSRHNNEKGYDRKGYFSYKRKFKNRFDAIGRELGDYNPSSENNLCPYFALKVISKDNIRKNARKKVEMEKDKYKYEFSEQSKIPVTSLQNNDPRFVDFLDSKVEEIYKGEIEYQRGLYKGLIDQSKQMPFHLTNIINYDEDEQNMLVFMELLPFSLADILEDKLNEYKENKEVFHDPIWTGQVLSMMLNTSLAIKILGSHGDPHAGNMMIRDHGFGWFPVLSDAIDPKKTTQTSTLAFVLNEYAGTQDPKYVFHPSDKSFEGPQLDTYCITKSGFSCLTGELDAGNRVGSRAHENNKLIPRTSKIKELLRKGSESKPQYCYSSIDKYIVELRSAIKEMGFMIKRVSFDGHNYTIIEDLDDEAYKEESLPKEIGIDTLYVVGSASMMFKLKYQAKIDRMDESGLAEMAKEYNSLMGSDLLPQEVSNLQNEYLTLLSRRKKVVQEEEITTQRDLTSVSQVLEPKLESLNGLVHTLDRYKRIGSQIAELERKVE